MLVKFNTSRFRIERQLKFTQAQIAELTDTTIRYIRDLESGKKSNPSGVLVYKFCKLLKIPIDALFEELDETKE